MNTAAALLIASTVISQMGYPAALFELTQGNTIYVSGEECSNPDYNNRSVSVSGSLSPSNIFTNATAASLLTAAIQEFETTGGCEYIHLDKSLSSKSFVTPGHPYAFMAVASMTCPEYFDQNGNVVWVDRFINSDWPHFEEEYLALNTAGSYYNRFSQYFLYNPLTGEKIYCDQSTFLFEALPLME